MRLTHDAGAPPVHRWLAAPMDVAARRMIERIRGAEDVAHVAVMPDVHLARDVCVGTAMATRRLIYPAAVGGDIGCGMLAMAFDACGDVLRDARRAGAVLRMLGQRIPIHRRHRARTLPMPPSLDGRDLSHAIVHSAAWRQVALELGTLGGGNHFIELQADEGDRLWLMIHSGSRIIGQQVKVHHLMESEGIGTVVSAGMRALDADAPAGQAYLRDQDWARRFAAANRQAMAGQVIEILREISHVECVESMSIHCDHNHVRREEHFGQRWFVHRKGAMPADEGLPGIIPGSMGTMSFHVEGRGQPDSLRSSAHGAGRLHSRSDARRLFSRADIQRQMQGIWFDPRQADALRDEAPRSYKNIEAVMRAQADLVKITRRLRPLLVYKGG